MMKSYKYEIDNDHVCSVEYRLPSPEKKLDDHEGRRPEWASNFFEAVYIPLNTSDHCLSNLEHDHTHEK